VRDYSPIEVAKLALNASFTLVVMSAAVTEPPIENDTSTTGPALIVYLLLVSSDLIQVLLLTPPASVVNHSLQAIADKMVSAVRTNSAFVVVPDVQVGIEPSVV
jgi:hypothetical protein